MTFITVKMTAADAESFIKEHLERDSSIKLNACVIVEHNIKQFELLPCLQVAKEAYDNCTAGHSPKVQAVIALRKAAAARGMELGLADSKSVVEQFIEKLAK